MSETKGYEPSEDEIRVGEGHMTQDERRMSNDRYRDQEKEVVRKLGATYLSPEYAIKESTKEYFHPYVDSKRLMDEISDGSVPTPEVDQTNVKEKLIAAMQRATEEIERNTAREIGEVEYQGRPYYDYGARVVNLSRDKVKEQISELKRQKDADMGEIDEAGKRIEANDLGGALKLLRGLVIFEDYHIAMSAVRGWSPTHGLNHSIGGWSEKTAMEAKQQFAEDMAVVDFFEKSEDQQK